ncbi:MAG: leucine-rich repeat domain-containing protein, partial [Treponemataceae bacterium]|nr:leucine-rich repeat domain-containing protein [Treponemataceae bacterium]
MRKYISLMCGAVLFALLAAGCSGAFGLDGKDVGELGSGAGGNGKDNPFKGTTWVNTEDGFTLEFTSDNACKITEGTTKAASIAREAAATEAALAGSYSYKVANDGGSFAATLKDSSGDVFAMFTITASGASSGRLVTSDGGVYTFTKKTGSGGTGGGSSSGGSTVVDANNPFADSTWTVLSGITDLVFTKDSATYANLDFSYTPEKKADGSYTATLISKLNGGNYGTFVIDTLHSPYGRYNVNDKGSYTCLKNVAADALEDYQIEDGQLVKYVGKQESVTIPTSVKWIGNEAFKDCDFIESVRIPSSVLSIGKDAFSGCTALKTVLYNGSLTWWREMLFYYDQQGETIGDATGLKGKTIVSTRINNTSWRFNSAVSYWKSTYANSNTVGMQIETWTGDSTELTIPAGATQINSRAFYNRTSIVSVTIPNTVTEIQQEAFLNAEKLTSVTIPDSVTNIGDRAFSGCKSLASVTIPGSMTNIGTSIFSGCSKLANIEISEGVETFGKYVFSGCESLESITIPSSVTNMGIGIFNGCNNLKEVIILEGGLTELKNDVFNDHPSIQHVTIPNSVTSIGSSTFSGCSGLTSIEIPSGVTKIGGSAFYGCKSLTRVKIPDSVTAIGGGAFSGCTGLESVEIPKGTSIGESAFSGCSSLTGVTIPDGMTEIGLYAFSKCTALQSVTIPASVTTINYSFYKCGSIGVVNYGGTLEQWCAVNNDGDLVSGAERILLSDKVTDIKQKTELVIPDGVTEIGRAAFSGCSTIETVTIPSGVTKIGWNAFENCASLESVEIPTTMKNIGQNAFTGCDTLKTVTYKGTQRDWTGVS